MKDSTNTLLRSLPSIDEVLRHPGVRSMVLEYGHATVAAWSREELAVVRAGLLEGDIAGNRSMLGDAVADRVASRAESADIGRLGRVVNATGVVLHTGLGRAPLSRDSATAMVELSGTANVEIDLESGRRRYRGFQLQPTWRKLTGAEEVLIVNNNAAATLLALQSLCAGKEVIISRGQLIEIGGSFRLPEIFELSGAILREVGTTNRTHLADYEKAIGPDTAAIMHVHPSNYEVVGFTAMPAIDELTALSHRHNLLAVDDLGSGALIDFGRFGLPGTSTFSQSIRAGADVVLGSGDKLLGGPQCGIVLGKANAVCQMRHHPLARATRVGKLTLAALVATLDAYARGEAEREIPTIKLLAQSEEALFQRARQIEHDLGDSDLLQITVAKDVAAVGGGALPTAKLPTAVLAVRHVEMSEQELARRLRTGKIRVLPRVQNDSVIIDLRSVDPDDDSKIALALRLLSHSYC